MITDTFRYGVRWLDTAFKSGVKPPHSIFCLAPLALLACVPALASTPSRVEVPPAQHADGESFAEMPLPQAFPSARNLRLTLSLDNASAANNAEFEIGDTIFGWDRGEWFVRRFDGHLSAAGGGTGRRTLAVRIQWDRWGEGSGTPCLPPSRVSFTADGHSVGFGGGLVPAWFDPDTFDTIRVTSRGGAQGVSATADWHVDGTVMILR
jgi:hypothetical protein